MAANRISFDVSHDLHCSPPRGRWESGSLWTLLVLKHKLEPFIELIVDAVKLERLLQERSQLFPGESIDHQEREWLLRILVDGEPNFLSELSGMELLTGHMQLGSVTDLYDSAKGNGCSIESARDSLSRLIKGIEGDVSERLFLFIPADRASYFNNPDAVLGKGIVAAFPEAVQDMRDAGNCYALDLPTAAVFHAMRVAEHGLKKIARILRVKLRDKGQYFSVEYGDWNKIIVGIRGKVDAARRLPAGAKRENRLRVYSEVADHCEYMKDTWRNSICHARKDFNLPGALEALQQVRGFMQIAAKGINAQ
jgi:hypothetical protein